MTEYLNRFSKSKDLERFFISKFTATIYATLITHFFYNLNSKSVKEFQLPNGKIKAIKRHFKSTITESKKALRLQRSTVDPIHYKNFKKDVRTHFPEFFILIQEVEKVFKIDELKSYPQIMNNNISAKMSEISDPETKLVTGITESFLSHRNKLPTNKQLNKILQRSLSPKLLKTYAQQLIKEPGWVRSITESLKLQLDVRNRFELRLYKKWKKPFDLMEILIGLSLAYGQQKKNKLSTNGNITNPKHAALIKIHARSLIMSNEIFALVRTGYPDGAYARWRSLHELSVISFFLRQESDDVSLRYFEHEAMRDYKEAKEYQVFCKRIGYKPYTKKQMEFFTKKHDDLITKYGKEFEYHNGYEWIPTSIIKN